MIIAVFSAKGGACKSTTALNLGAALVRQGVPVTLVNLDMSRTLLDYAGALPGATFTESLPAQAAAEGVVILDCPPATTDANAAAIMARCDVVLIPTQPARVACDEALDAARIALEAGRPARILLTKHTPRVDYANEIKAQLEKEIKRLRSRGRVALCTTVVPFAHDFVRAENARRTIFSQAECGAGARAYARLAREVMTWQQIAKQP